MSRVDEPGSQSIRAQIGIRTEDPAVFHPITLEEALEVAQIIAADESLDREYARAAETGIVLDLMPGDLTPRKDVVAQALGLSVRTIRRRELVWELSNQLERFSLVMRALRLLIAKRGAKV